MISAYTGFERTIGGAVMARVPAAVSAQSRRHIDSHAGEWTQFTAISRPPRGWVRAIREALGMSSAVLAARLGVTASAVTRMEQSESAGHIRMDTLAAAADALGCDVFYVLVPRRPLEEVVRDRAHEIAHDLALSVEHSMMLEDQATGRLDEIEDIIAGEIIDGGGLWA
jgi:predicted DNA-binding mobile mystery protein A